MKADYRNWMPRSMICGVLAAGAGALVLALAFGLTGLAGGTAKAVLTAVFAVLAAACIVAAVWMIAMYRAFSYNGKRQMSRQIIEGIAQNVTVPKGGRILDVGCGSGALAIACARRNPDARVVGIDRWGREYASFSQPLCARNAQAEGAVNAEFRQGDANKLAFPDESFDAVVSNYVYHNILSDDRQALLLETLRVLKKGGTFAIHDIFSRSKYGDMQAFAQKLRDMGYAEVSLEDTTGGRFMSRFEASWMGLAGSALLTGRK